MDTQGQQPDDVAALANVEELLRQSSELSARLSKELARGGDSSAEPAAPMPSPAGQEEGDEGMLDPGVLEKLSALLADSAPPNPQARAVQEEAGNTALSTYGSTASAPTAEEADILQSKAESVVAMLDEATALKRQNPFAGFRFQDLIQRLSLNQNVKVYTKKVPGERLVQGTVAEQLLSVVDCENERHMHRLRQVQEDYEGRMQQMNVDHKDEIERMKQQLIKDRLETEKRCEEKLDQNKQTLQSQTEVLAKEGLKSQLETERTRDELALVSEDAAALKKLLFFWKKKNAALKNQFDNCERELQLASEKLKDYHHLHEMDAYKVHRFCGQLREKEMQARWRGEEAQRKIKELQQEMAQLRGDAGGKDVPSMTPSPLVHNASSSQRNDPADSTLWDRLKNDVNESRFQLSERCARLLGLAAATPVPVSAAPTTKSASEGTAADIAALKDGIRLRDDQIDILLSALRYRDKTVEDLRGDLEAKTAQLLEAQTKAFEPFQCEDLVSENDSLQRQLNDAKEIIYSMQKQIQDERQQIAEERKVRADREIDSSRQQAEEEQRMRQMLREKETEIIRLRNRLQAPGGKGATDASGAELHVVRLEQSKTELQEQVVLLEEERTRLKHYVGSLSSRLEQTLSQLEHRNQKLRQYESLAQNLTLSPRNPGVSPLRPTASAVQASSPNTGGYTPIPTPSVAGRLFL